MTNNDLLVIGRITRIHGVHGEVKVRPFTESVNAMGIFRRLYICPADKPPYLADVIQVKPHKYDVLIRFKHVPSREAAEALIGMDLAIERSWLPPTEEDEFYWVDLIGLQAQDTNGASLGVVKNILPVGEADILVLDHDGREILVPFRNEIIQDVNLPMKRIVIQPVDGLLDLQLNIASS